MPNASEVFRDFIRFTGDGKPNAPTNAPLPVGDPQSGQHNPAKAEIRSWAAAIEALNGNPSALDARLIPIENSLSPTFASRAAAVTGAPNVPASVARILVREGNFLVERSRTATADDPLFTTGSQWAVMARYPNQVEVAETVVRKGGDLPAGANLNLIREPGTYLMNANQGYVSAPADLIATEAYHLIVSAQGGITGRGDTRFVHQQIISLKRLEAGRRYIRHRTYDRQDPVQLNWAWVSMARVDTELAAQRGTLPTGTDLATITLPGMYQLAAGGPYANMPADANPSRAYWLEVTNPGGASGVGSSRFQRQQLISMSVDGLGTPTQSRVIYDRRLDTEDPQSAVGINMWVRLDSAAVGGGGAASPLAGKTIVCFGDSITEGNGAFRWPSRLAARLGATVINGGFGGTRMGAHLTSWNGLYDPMSMYRVSERIKNGDWAILTAAAQALFEAENDDNRPHAAALAAVDWAQVDIIVIAYGTNDFTGDRAIGTDADSTGDTFKGAINMTVANILETYPHIQILFVTPMWRARVPPANTDSNVTPNGINLFLRDYAQAIRERAAALQIPVADLFSESGINIHNWPTYIPDGLHPTSDRGVQRITGYVAGQLEAKF